MGRDFNVGYSPERINPGDKVNTLDTIVKVVGATHRKLLMRCMVYDMVVAQALKVSSIKVAEASDH